MNADELAARLNPQRLLATRIGLLQRMLLLADGAVKKRTPVKRGTLRRSIATQVDVPGERGRVGTNLDYARHVYFGTKAHTITPNAAKALHWAGARHPVRSVRHPGTAANPFLENGLNDVRGAIEQAAADAGERFLSGVS